MVWETVLVTLAVLHVVHGCALHEDCRRKNIDDPEDDKFEWRCSHNGKLSTKMWLNTGTCRKERRLLKPICVTDADCGVNRLCGQINSRRICFPKPIALANLTMYFAPCNTSDECKSPLLTCGVYDDSVSTTDKLCLYRYQVKIMNFGDPESIPRDLHTKQDAESEGKKDLGVTCEADNENDQLRDLECRDHCTIFDCHGIKK
ncbi:hypothetical protein L596_017632 [Steinernema carpocapsae]|uniref:Uncharacterized protein n=1 Tax=Steinernema carpocapsae TaxID=34508 RepID=A0A4U5N283_STECR|nr:hypothetical protein L596_017632 [Steinernema carpocapsae]